MTTLQLAVSISTDRDGFMRRTCPSCGRDFKTRIDPVDLQWALSSYCRRTEHDVGEERDDKRPRSYIWCPYCAQQNEAEQTLTEETVAYLKRIVYREVVAPKLNEAFAALEDSHGGRSHSGGPFSMSVKFTHFRPVLPVRPIHGPEPADFKIVKLLCCDKAIKVSEGWADVCKCSFCGTEVALV